MDHSKLLKKSTLLILALIADFSLNQTSAQSSKTGLQPVKTDFHWPEGKKMAISFSFDDGRVTQADNCIPLLDKYGVKATFYLQPNSRLMERLDVWQKAAKNGHEIGNHSIVHPCPGNFPWARNRALDDYTIDSFSAELDSAGKLLYQLLGVYPRAFAYFCGQTFLGRGKNAVSYVPLIAAKFETGRGWLDEAPNDPSYCDMSYLTGMELDGKTFDQMKLLIDDTKSKGFWLILAGHETKSESANQTSVLRTIEEICRLARDPSNEIWLDNIHNIAAYIKEKRGEKPFE